MIMMKEIKDFDYTIKKEEETESDITITIKEVLDKDSIEELSLKLESEYETNFVISCCAMSILCCQRTNYK